jgi:hypothetical protein
MRRKTRLTVVGGCWPRSPWRDSPSSDCHYVVVFPEALPIAYFVLTFTTVVVGGVLCRPYLRIGGRGFTLGPAVRHVGWWIPALAIAGVVAKWAVILSDAGGPKGDRIRTAAGGYALRYKESVTEVSRTEWLAARQLESRVLAAAPASFACGVWYWCVACARAEPSDVVPPRGNSAGETERAASDRT